MRDGSTTSLGPPSSFLNRRTSLPLLICGFASPAFLRRACRLLDSTFILAAPTPRLLLPCCAFDRRHLTVSMYSMTCSLGVTFSHRTSQICAHSRDAERFLVMSRRTFRETRHLVYSFWSVLSSLHLSGVLFELSSRFNHVQARFSDPRRRRSTDFKRD